MSTQSTQSNMPLERVAAQAPISQQTGDGQQRQQTQTQRRGGRGGRGGRGRGNRHQGSNKGVIEARLSPIVPTENRNLAPSNPSKKATPLNNDPMYQDVDLDGFYPMRQTRSNRKFTPTLEGYIPLCRETYNQLSAANKTMAKYVSESMFMWYCCQHLYVELCQ